MVLAATRSRTFSHCMVHIAPSAPYNVSLRITTRSLEYVPILLYLMFPKELGYCHYCYSGKSVGVTTI